jgi:hypothetical protein
MPCQPEEADQCATKHDATHCALIHAKSRIDPVLFGQYMNVETVVTKEHPGNGWVYLLRSESAQTYENLDKGLQELDQYLRRTIPCTETQFQPIGDEQECIVLGGSHVLFSELIQPTGNFQSGVDVWRMNGTLPPRKRISADTAGNPDIQLLIPGFKRLSRQLQVDFCINVHGSEGKRRREPVRSIYEEAAMESATKKKRTRRTTNIRKTQPTTISTAPSTDNDCGDISELDEDEILQHAEMLANLSNGHHPIDAKPKKSAQHESIISALTRAMDAISQAHIIALKAKDDTIKAMETASHALAETVRVQSILITGHGAHEP